MAYPTTFTNKIHKMCVFKLNPICMGIIKNITPDNDMMIGDKKFESGLLDR